MRCNMNCNAAIKQELRNKRIRYQDLVTCSGYSIQTIKYWMNRPLNNWREMVLRQCISRLEQTMLLEDRA